MATMSNIRDECIAINTSVTTDAKSDFGELDNFSWPQIIVNGVHKRASPEDIKMFLTKMNICYRKIKKIPNKDFCFITFNKKEDEVAALDIINGAVLKNMKLRAETRAFNHERHSKKHSISQDDDTISPKRVKVEQKQVKDAVAPWWNLPYEDQLTKKSLEMTETLKQLVQKLRLSYKDKAKGSQGGGTSASSHHRKPYWGSATTSFKPPSLKRSFSVETEGSCSVSSPELLSPMASDTPSWLRTSQTNQFVVPMLPILASKQSIGYRNKCEFTFGYDVYGLPTLGFRVSGFSEGVTIGPPWDCPTVPRAMKRVVLAVIRFIRESPFKVYNQNNHKGVWRLLTCRYSARTHDLLVMLCVSHKEIEEKSKKDETEKEKQRRESSSSKWQSELKRLSDVLQSLQRRRKSSKNSNSNTVMKEEDDDEEEEEVEDNSFDITENRSKEDNGNIQIEDFIEGKQDIDNDMDSSNLLTSTSSTSTTFQQEIFPLITGFCLQVYDGLSVPHSDHPIIPVFGKMYIEEYLLSTRFHISPQSFFQVNTPTAELLFQYVIDSCEKKDVLVSNEMTRESISPSNKYNNIHTNSTSNSSSQSQGGICVLDICCGTGTIGLCYANSHTLLQNKEDTSAISRPPPTTTTTATTTSWPVSVVGIELCSTAVEDAKKNAILNQITTTTITADTLSPCSSTDSLEIPTVTTTSPPLPEAASTTPSSPTSSTLISTLLFEPQMTMPVIDRESTVIEATVIEKANVVEEKESHCKAIFICARAEAVLGNLLKNTTSTSSGDNHDSKRSNTTTTTLTTTTLPQSKELKEATDGKKLIAIVDPPREGLHTDCLRAIRNCDRIERLVYISCNPTKSFLRDGLILCGPGSKKLEGVAFRPVEARAVDLFPMTPHCELVVIFDRCSLEDTITNVIAPAGTGAVAVADTVPIASCTEVDSTAVSGGIISSLLQDTILPILAIDTSCEGSERDCNYDI